MADVLPPELEMDDLTDPTGKKLVDLADLKAVLDDIVDNKNIITDRTDLNNCIDIGSVYYCNSNTTAKTLTNSPINFAFWMYVQSINFNKIYGYRTQILFPYNEACIYIRVNTADFLDGNPSWSNWKKLEDVSDKYMPSNGGTMSGNLTISSGTTTGNGLDNGFKGDITTGELIVGNKVKVRADVEGGNITLYSPKGNFFEMDAYNGNLRIWGGENGTEKQLFALDANTGAISLPAIALPVSSGGSGQRSTNTKSYGGGYTLRKWGNVVQLQIYDTNVFAANSQVQKIYLDVAHRPVDNCYFVLHGFNGGLRVPIVVSIMQSSGLLQVVNSNSYQIGGCYGEVVYLVP